MKAWAKNIFPVVFLYLLNIMDPGISLFQQIEKFNLVLEFNGYKSHIINGEGWIGGGIQIFHLEYISAEIESHCSKANNSYDRIFLNSYSTRFI